MAPRGCHARFWLWETASWWRRQIPTTIAILQHLQQQGGRPGVLTRGYKADQSKHPAPVAARPSQPGRTHCNRYGDEPALIWRRTHAPVMIDPQRVGGGLFCWNVTLRSTSLVCDDGLQHLPLHRDIEVIVFDERGQRQWLAARRPDARTIEHPAPPGLAAPPSCFTTPASSSTHLPGHCVRKRATALCRIELDWWLGASANIQRTSLTPRAARPRAHLGYRRHFRPARPIFQQLAVGWQIHGHASARPCRPQHMPWPPCAASHRDREGCCQTIA